MTAPAMKVNGPKVEEYIRTVYERLEKLSEHRATILAVAEKADAESAPDKFYQGKSALSLAAESMVSAIDSTAKALQEAANAAGAHKDEQERLSCLTGEEFRELSPIPPISG